MSAKYQQLAAILRSEILQLQRRSGVRLPTEQVLAQRYHMSRQTVRHALQLLEEEGLIQRRQGSGSYIREPEPVANAQRQVAIVTAFPDEYIYPALIHDAQSTLSRAGYAPLIFGTGNRVSQEREILSELLALSVAGVLIQGSKTTLPTPNADLFLQLRQRGIPVLFFQGGYPNLPDFPCLPDDPATGAALLTKYLISKGHHRICGIFQWDDSRGLQRYQGVMTVLQEQNLPMEDARFFWYSAGEQEALLRDDWDRLESFLARQLTGDTALICHNDMLANRLIQRLLDNGRAAPDDVAVVSFDNSYYSQIGPVPITSLGCRGKRTGVAAAEALLALLAGETPKAAPPEWMLFPRDSG